MPRRRHHSPIDVLGDDAVIQTFCHLACRLSLRRCRSVCCLWRRLLSEQTSVIWDHAWLNTTASNAIGILERAPAGEKISIENGTVLRGQVVLKRPIHLRANGVQMHGKLYLQTGGRGESADTAGNHRGVVEGLNISHYMDEAILVTGGGWPWTGQGWELRACSITSSRAGRSSTAIILRDSGSLSLVDCSVRNTVHAVCLSGGAIIGTACSLTVSGSTISDTKSAIITRGGGYVHVENSTFHSNEAALLLDHRVTGVARLNSVDGSMFGNWAVRHTLVTHGKHRTLTLLLLLRLSHATQRPSGFRCVTNVYSSTEDNEDEEEDDGAEGVEEESGQGVGAANGEDIAGASGTVQGVTPTEHGTAQIDDPLAGGTETSTMSGTGEQQDGGGVGSSGAQANASFWVQCDHCQLWRRLPASEAESVPLLSSWTCAHYPDPRFRSCQFAEQEPNAAEGEVELFTVQEVIGRKVSAGEMIRTAFTQRCYATWPPSR